ncbi:MAG: hypothetical protein ABR582_05285 [Gemmatimonadaceae bacterium]
MRSLAVVSIVALLAACVKSETSTPAADTSTAAMAPAPAPAPAPAAAPAAAPLSLQSVKGRYTVTSRGQGPDTSVVTYELNATGDTTGWTITYPKRAAVPVRIISVSGDSIVAETGPFTSVRRSGTPVTTRTTYRYENGVLVGTTVAHYRVSGPDTVRTFTITSVKK